MSLRSLLAKVIDEEEAAGADADAADSAGAGSAPEPDPEDEDDAEADVAAAEARGRAAGIAAERRRWSDVLGSEAAEGRIGQAVVALAKTPAPAADIIAILSAGADGSAQTSAMKKRLEEQENPDTGRGNAEVDDDRRAAIRKQALSKVNRGRKRPGKKD